MAAQPTQSPTYATEVTLELRGKIAGAIGVLVCTVSLGLLLWRELCEWRMKRRVGESSTLGEILRRGVRFFMWMFCLLDGPHFVTMIVGKDDFDDGLIYLCFYLMHCISTSCMYVAFCLFGLLWMHILNFNVKIKKIALGFAVMVSIAFFVFTGCVVAALYQDTTRRQDNALFQLFYYVVPISLLVSSLLFLMFGLYAQSKLNAWFVTKTSWQKSVICRLNANVAVCTMLCVLRAVMVWVLYMERYGLTQSQFFTSPFDWHPLLWTLSSQIVPNYGLVFTLVLMTDMSRRQGHNVPFKDSPATDSGGILSNQHFQEDSSERFMFNLVTDSPALSRLGLGGAGAREGDRHSDPFYEALMGDELSP